MEQYKKMSSTDKPVKVNPYNTRSKAMKSKSVEKKGSINNSIKSSVSQSVIKRNHKKEENYKVIESSDDDDDDDADDDENNNDSESDFKTDSDEDYTSEEEDKYSKSRKRARNEDLEYKKFLAELFPSKYMKQQIESIEQEYSSDDTGDDDTSITHRKRTQNSVCPPAPVKRRLSYRYHPDDDEFQDGDYERRNKCSTPIRRNNSIIPSNPSKYNISFIIGGPNLENPDEEDDGDYYDEREALYDENYDDTEDDSENNDSDDSDSVEDNVGDILNNIKNEDKDNMVIVNDEIHTTKNTSSELQEILNKQIASSPPPPPIKITNKNKKLETEALDKIKEMFNDLNPEHKELSVIKNLFESIKQKETDHIKRKERQEKKEKVKNTKNLKKLLKERDVMNDLQYFNEKMSLEEQEYTLKELELIKQHSDISKPYRLTLIESNIPSHYKAIAYRKISTLKRMDPGCSEYNKMKNWVDTFMRIPFGKYNNLPITLSNDGVDKCHEFMENAKNILDNAVYGLDDAKLQIMQMIGQWIVNPSAIGTAIAIKGPMGTGKTTLVKEGISKILGREFAFIALGGATDSSFLEGHSYTYEGSTWGKIVDLLIKCKSMNPVIYFDELDKISDTPKGEEIAGILTHLTDTSQNSEFHDKYFSEIDFDLSRCLFIFSYNDESKVNRILLDRMYRIQTKGYEQKQKSIIAHKYLLPKICEQVKFDMSDITISDDTMNYIISNYTDKEDGVRTLKRCLEIIYTKLNLYRLMKPKSNLFESEMSVNVEFPMNVTNHVVDSLIKKNTEKGSWQNMYS